MNIDIFIRHIPTWSPSTGLDREDVRKENRRILYGAQVPRKRKHYHSDRTFRALLKSECGIFATCGLKLHTE
jgi:hypothetical protein